MGIKNNFVNVSINTISFNEIEKFKKIIIIGLYLCLIFLIIYFFDSNYYKRLFGNIVMEIKNEQRMELKERVEYDYFNKVIKDAYITSCALKYAKQFNIDSSLFIALMKTESQFNPKAINYNYNSIDRGLYQLNDKTFSHLEPNDFFNPEINIKNAAIYLSWCLQKSGNNLIKALAYYNAGFGCVSRKTVGESTLNYINNIINDKFVYDLELSDTLKREFYF